ncbi:hypothetical protein [Streptomyces mirabilis]|uniref:hypothetical protein n=1 Tax=Streptomyces mirabilis TaxID=68239 RepID=UPI00369FE754
MTSASELIRPTTRRQLLETARSLRKATIEACWQDAGFAPVALDDPPSTERAAMFASYSAGVDRTDEQHVERALGVFEALLRAKKAHDERYPHVASNCRDGVQRALGQDGYQLTERLQILRFGGWRPEHATSDADSYQVAVRLLVGARNQMERLPALVAGLSEERLRDILLVSLNAFFEGVAMFMRTGSGAISVASAVFRHVEHAAPRLGAEFVSQAAPGRSASTRSPVVVFDPVPECRAFGFGRGTRSDAAHVRPHH